MMLRPRSRLARGLLALLGALVSLGCSASDPLAPSAGVESVFVVPESLDELSAERFFDQPWPSELRTVDGVPQFRGFYNPRNMALVAEYVEATEGLLEGFSPVAAGYLRFSGPIDPASLPADPLAATSPDASVQLIDVDPSSPEHGRRKLVSLSYWEPEGVYLRAHTLRFMPTFGFPLRPSTRYALVVTRELRATGGAAVEPSAHLRQVLGLEPADGARATARALLDSAVSELGALGLGADRIAHLAVFRTSDPTAELARVRDDLRNNAAPPVLRADGWELGGSTATYDEYLGSYGPSPNYQSGVVPFWSYGDGGGFQIVDGVAEVIDEFDARFSLTVPKSAGCPMPAAGYPLTLYAHGTGGDYRSHLSFAATLAEQCIASMGVDQIFHGTRPGAPSSAEEVSLLFFNFQNVIAARTNGRQSALDEVQRARLFTETGAVVPASVSATGAEIRFDPSKLLFFGHSQGGLNGPLYLAIDDSSRGGVLSGSGSIIAIALLDKTEPPPAIPNLVAGVLLGLSREERVEYDYYHPVVALAQWLIDPVDAIHYARHSVVEPLPGRQPKSLYLTEGIGPDGVGDHYAPPKGTEAQAIALGVPLQLPAQHPIAELDWGGPTPVTVGPDGLSGNLAGGLASGVLAQWPPAAGDDGHFVVFDVPAARAQAGSFLRELAAAPAGRVPAP